MLQQGMADMGFKELVPEQFAGHIITCFYYPQHPNFSFEAFYMKLSDLGGAFQQTLRNLGITIFNFQTKSFILAK